MLKVILSQSMKPKMIILFVGPVVGLEQLSDSGTSLTPSRRDSRARDLSSHGAN